jgi:hypothetical protein
VLQWPVAIAKTSGDVVPTAAAIGITFARGGAPMAILVIRCMGHTAPMVVSLIGVAIPTAVGAIASTTVAFCRNDVFGNGSGVRWLDECAAKSTMRG